MQIMSRAGIAWALAFDEAQLQDREGRPLRGFDDGTLSVDTDGTIGIWPISSGSRDSPAVTFSNQDRGTARSVHAYRFIAYPTIAIAIDPTSVLVVRPLKPRGLPWRVGMTTKEAAEAAERLSSMHPPASPE